MASAGRRRRPLFVRIKRCQVEMEINIFARARTRERRRNPRFSRDATRRGYEIRAKKFTGIFQLRKIGSLVRTCGATGGADLNTYGDTRPGAAEKYTGGSGIRAVKKALLPGKIVGARGTS